MSINWERSTICYFWFPYVFEAGQGGHLVKIGVTSNIRSRASGIATGCPYDCWKIYGFWMPHIHSHELETILHKYFDAYRQRGEWFSIPMDVWLEFEAALPIAFHGAKMPLLYSNGDNVGKGWFVTSDWPLGHPNYSEAA